MIRSAQLRLLILICLGMLLTGNIQVKAANLLSKSLKFQRIFINLYKSFLKQIVL